MRLIKNTESLMIRRNTHLRSLFIEYPRLESESNISAALSNHHSSEASFNLTVTHASADGIAVKIPALLSGMFELIIQDGKQRFSKRIALQ